MNKKWKSAAEEMTKLKEEFLQTRSTLSISVHKTLIYRALPMLSRLAPETGEFYCRIKDILIDEVCHPDRTGDYEKGAGRHYYCVTDSHGIKKRPSHGYYKNGIRKYAKSARSMLEEDYTMALTMYMAGFRKIAAGYLARAIHMLSDICCLPHATGMTYFSSKGNIHKAYESMARAMYPDSVPERMITKDQLHILDSENGFGEAVNSIAEAQINEPKQLLSDPVGSVKNRLYIAEGAVAAILFKFYNDVSGKSRVSRYITNNSRICGHDISIDISENGLILIKDGIPLSVMTDKKTSCTLFRAAHRFNGMYTFSPVSDDKGRVIILDSNSLRAMNPNRKKQMYMIK